MIRAASRKQTGEPVILLGVTEENVNRLKEGKPIRVDLAQFEVGLEGDLVILYGKTHRAVVDDLNASGIRLPDDAVAQADAIDEAL